MFDKKIRMNTRTPSPCSGCSERRIEPNCHGNCPVDRRGGYGYEAWLSEIASIKQERKKHELLAAGKFKY